MKDKIYIRNLSQEILIGINPEERINKQQVLVNVTLEVDCTKPCKSDDINDAVDYSVIHDEIVSLMNDTHFDLIETLAEQVSQLCLRKSGVDSALVCIDKPEALKYAESVAVEIFRKK